MSQPINVSITMDAESFHKFAQFDLFRHQKRWKRPLLFTGILLVLRTNTKKLGLPRPFYRLQLEDAGVSVWMAGEQDKPEPSHQYSWQGIHLAYRTPDAIYLYVQPTQAYLFNADLDPVWKYLGIHLSPRQLRDLR